MSAAQPGHVRTADQVCPVCLWPDRGAAVCGECGWQLLGDYTLGPASRSDEREFAARLADRQRGHDLRAAVRAAGPRAERDMPRLRQLAELVRHGHPRPGLIDRALADVDAADPAVVPGQAGVSFALTRLVAGKTEAIAFVEIGPDAISLQTLIAGRMGVPRQLVGDSLSWTGIFPLLPDDENLRYLRMAGGVGEPGRRPGNDDHGAGRDTATLAHLLTVVDKAVEPALSRLMAAAAAAAVAANRAELTNSRPSPASHRLDIVLVRRLLRWPVLDAAIRCARSVLRPVAEMVVGGSAGDLASVVGDVAVQAPLRYGYDLVLVHVDQRSRVVEVKPHELFPAGAAVLPSTKPSATAEVAPVPGHAADRLALPIVARRGRVSEPRDPADLEEHRPLIEMAAMSGTASRPTRLQVSLTGPGELDVQATPGLLAAEAAMRSDWPRLIGGLPKRLPPRDPLGAAGLDLVLLIELGGADKAVARRVRLARELVEAFRREPPAVRIALAGYRDHFSRHHLDAIKDLEREDEALIVGCRLTAPGRALAIFQDDDRWKEVAIQDNNAAPVEDALVMIAQSGWEWRARARRVLLVIGARPPHPAKEGPHGDTMLPCPHGFSWDGALRRIGREQPVECFAVLDRARLSGYADQAWKKLGAQGIYPAGSVTAEQLVRMVGTRPQAVADKLRLARYVGPGADRRGGAGGEKADDERAW